MKKVARFLKQLDRQTKAGLAVAAAGLIVLVLALFFWPGATNQKNSVVSIPSDSCQVSNTITYRCYKTELTGIVDEKSPEAAFTFIKRQYPKLPYVQSQCHQLVHVIGRAAYARYKNLGDTFAHGDQFCWSGYYHGVMEQVIAEKGTDYTLKNANSICAPMAKKQKYGFYHFNCVHGLGHGFMEARAGNLLVSLTDCDRLNDSWEKSSCYGGVFMQNIMNEQSPDAAADHHSAYLKSEEPMYPCTAVESRYKEQCYLMQTSYVLQVDGYDFGKVFGACAAIEPQYLNTCYQSLGRDASGQSTYHAEQTKNTCLLGPTIAARANCIIGAAKDYVSNFHGIGEANAMCQALPADLKDICTSTVTSYYSGF